MMQDLLSEDLLNKADADFNPGDRVMHRVYSSLSSNAHMVVENIVGSWVEVAIYYSKEQKKLWWFEARELKRDDSAPPGFIARPERPRIFVDRPA